MPPMPPTSPEKAFTTISGRSIDQRAVPVGTAVRDHVGHPHEARGVGLFPWIECDDAGDTAHVRYSRSTNTPRSSTRTDSPVRSNSRPEGSLWLS